LLRVGGHSDHISGRHAVILAKATSQGGEKLVAQTQRRLSQQWPALLHSQLSQLEMALIPQLSRMLPVNELPLTRADEEELAAFAFQKRHFDASQVAVRRFVLNSLPLQRFSLLPELLQQLCVLYVVQQQPISLVCRQLNLKGRQDVQQQLREAIRILLL